MSFKKTLNCVLVLFCFTQIVNAQDESTHKITLSSYVDTYFSGYDTDLSQNEFQPFITVGARDNTFGLNIAQIGVNYKHDFLRSNIILHYGDIAQATWSSEFNFVQEANIGVKLAENLWLDAGLFATHIGTESFLPKNNMLSSTAFKTFNEPFYQAGAKLSYSVSDWDFELWALNGYNNFVDNNDAKSVGVLISKNLNESTSITYTNLYGRESLDGVNPEQNRFYQNIYLNKNWNDKWYLTVGFDYGIQTNSDLNNPNETATMYAGILTTRHQFNPKFSITGRAEIFNDKNGFISGIITDPERNEDY
ncbi:MAG: outer membrane beta-barrel protein [Bacteroidota bacterium]